MIKFLALLLAIPFLLVAMVILVVIVLFSKIFRRKKQGKVNDNIENDDIFSCVIIDGEEKEQKSQPGP